jgi:hypothetical protein
MLWKWRIRQVNWKGSGYDVLAITPTFLAPVDPGPPPEWDQGTGELQVDYQATSQDFWRLLELHRPIAILSHSRGNPIDKSWELEVSATNIKHGGWKNDFVPPKKPNIGGAADDFSPEKGKGPIAQDPPDRTQAAGLTRASNLPMAEIVAAVTAKVPTLNAFIDPTGIVGAFVSEYMAYHVAWAREYNVADPCMKLLLSGHTHVGGGVLNTEGEQAVEAALDEVIKKLPKP